MKKYYLRDDVEVRDERGLQDDGDVGGVEQLDGVGGVLAAVPRWLDRQVHAEALRTQHVFTTQEENKQYRLINNNQQKLFQTNFTIKQNCY